MAECFQKSGLHLCQEWKFFPTIYAIDMYPLPIVVET